MDGMSIVHSHRPSLTYRECEATCEARAASSLIDHGGCWSAAGLVYSSDCDSSILKFPDG
eukprot:scaffold46664_cov63-Attheya_sp.AAC.1